MNLISRRMAERERVKDRFFSCLNTQLAGEFIVVEAGHTTCSDAQRGCHKQDVLRDLAP
jgi:hypothetical protein